MSLMALLSLGTEGCPNTKSPWLTRILDRPHRLPRTQLQPCLDPVAHPVHTCTDPPASSSPSTPRRVTTKLDCSPEGTKKRTTCEETTIPFSVLTTSHEPPCVLPIQADHIPWEKRCGVSRLVTLRVLRAVRTTIKGFPSMALRIAVDGPFQWR